MCTYLGEDAVADGVVAEGGDTDADARLRLNPVDANAFRDRASFWLIKRDYERAVRDGDEAVRLNSKDPDNWKK